MSRRRRTARVAAPARALTGALGVALALVGVLAARGSAGGPLLGALLWLLAAVVLHDAVVAPALVASGRVLEVLCAGSAAAFRVSVAALSVVAVMTLVVVPGLAVRAEGPRNPTVHPNDYAAVLAVAWTAAAVVVLLACAAGRLTRRRSAGGRGARSSCAPRSGRSRGARGAAAGEGPGPSTS
jgi:hypothetical protein